MVYVRFNFVLGNSSKHYWFFTVCLVICGFWLASFYVTKVTDDSNKGSAVFGLFFSNYDRNCTKLFSKFIVNDFLVAVVSVLSVVVNTLTLVVHFNKGVSFVEIVTVLSNKIYPVVGTIALSVGAYVLAIWVGRIVYKTMQTVEKLKSKLDD